MRPSAIALVPALIAFAVAEVVCRSLLNLSDQILPLIVFPVAFVAWALTTKQLIARRTRHNKP